MCFHTQYFSLKCLIDFVWYIKQFESREKNGLSLYSFKPEHLCCLWLWVEYPWNNFGTILRVICRIQTHLLSCEFNEVESWFSLFNLKFIESASLNKFLPMIHFVDSKRRTRVNWNKFHTLLALLNHNLLILAFMDGVVQCFRTWCSGLSFNVKCELWCGFATY